MRLINTKSLELHEFFDSQIPKSYAILSHVWGPEEISFQEWELLEAKRRPDSEPLALVAVAFLLGTRPEVIETKDGYSKVLGFCNLCQDKGYEWAWADTCCIDKTVSLEVLKKHIMQKSDFLQGSAELSEAINSMYCWYRDASVCNVYLVDVNIGSFIFDEIVYDVLDNNDDLYDNNDDLDLPDLSRSNLDGLNSSGFVESRWFTRGWTLQELIAPLRVAFYDKEWNYISSKYFLSTAIKDITGIPNTVLTAPVMGSRYVGEIMSWASRRETSRVEDTAYCLLGLFDINMPLLYGEGKEAFVRLQRTIIAQTHDNTIFAWSIPHSSQFDWFGILALRRPLFKISSRLQRTNPVCRA
jgi:hypothetical protein